MAGGDHGETKKKAFLKIDAAFHRVQRYRDTTRSRLQIRVYVYPRTAENSLVPSLSSHRIKPVEKRNFYIFLEKVINVGSKFLPLSPVLYFRDSFLSSPVIIVAAQREDFSSNLLQFFFFPFLETDNQTVFPLFPFLPMNDEISSKG